MTYDQIAYDSGIDVVADDEASDSDNLSLIRCCLRLLQRSESPQELLDQLLPSLIKTVHRMHPAELIGPNAAVGLPPLSPGRLEALVTANDPSRRQLAACCPNLSAAQLDTLAADSRPSVRLAIATRPDCPVPWLESLWSDRDPAVRHAVLRNPNCPATILVQVCASPNPPSAALLRNPALPEDLALPLIQSKATWAQEHVQAIACWTPVVLERLIQGMDEDALWNFCCDLDRNPWLNPETLSWMALSELDSKFCEYHLREIAASHRHTPLDVLERLAADPIREVRVAVASNPHCTTELFGLMADDRDLRWVPFIGQFWPLTSLTPDG